VQCLARVSTLGRSPPRMPATRRERIRLARPAPTLSLLERECGESSPPTSPVPQGEAAREIVPEHKGMLAGAASRAPSSSRSCSPLHCRSSPSVPPAQEPASPRSCTCSSSGSSSHEWLLKPLPRTKRTTRAQGRQRPGRRHRVRPSPICVGGRTLSRRGGFLRSHCCCHCEAGTHSKSCQAREAIRQRARGR